MKSTIKILATIVCGALTVFSAHSQAVTLASGPAYTRTKQVVPLMNGNNGGVSGSQTAYVVSVKYEHFLPGNQFSLLTAYSRFDGYTFMFYEKGGVIDSGGGEVVGDGFSGVKVLRVDIGCAYQLINKLKRFYFAPFLVAGFQVSKSTGEEIYSALGKIDGPNYFEVEPISAESINTIQIVPSMGFHTGFVFWKRLDIGLSFQGVLGYKPYQKMYLKYEYKGTPQPTAEFEANGTGLFVTLGIGYRFAKLIK